MKKFDTQALTLIKQAVFQDKPFLLISVDSENLNAAYRGNENQLVDYIHQACVNDYDLRRILRRALQQATANELKPTLLKLKTA